MMARRVEEAHRVSALLQEVTIFRGSNFCSRDRVRLWDVLEKGVPLGTGSWGEVITATHPRLRRPVAVKFTRMTADDMTKPYDSNVDAWEEVFFLRMVHDLVVRGVCPNLPLLYTDYACDRGTEGAYLITVSELAVGDLQDICRKLWTDQTHSADFWYSVLFQLAAALETLHGRLWLHHRDIKAANILCLQIPPGGHWKYTICGMDFFVPNYGWQFLVADYNIAVCMDPHRSFFREQKTRSLGHRALIVEGEDEVSPLDPPLSQDRQGRIVAPRWTAEQRREMRAQGYMKPTVEFLKDQKVQFPLEFGEDTQDLIRMFTGGVRASHPEERHILLPRMPIQVQERLREYVSPPGRDDRVLHRLHTGRFLCHLAHRYSLFIQVPTRGSLQIAHHRIS